MILSVSCKFHWHRNWGSLTDSFFAYAYCLYGIMVKSELVNESYQYALLAGVHKSTN